MGNAKLNPWVQYVLVIGLVLSLILSFGALTKNVEVPSAADIADKVDVTGLSSEEVREIVSEEVAKIETTETSNTKLSNIWGAVFGECFNVIEGNAEDDVIAEIEDDNWDDLKEFIEDNLKDYDEGSLDLKKSYLVDDDTEVVVTELGYCNVGSTELGDEEDDKSAEVKLVYKFTYQDNSDNIINKGKVVVTGVVEYDEGDFSDKEVDLEFALA